MFFLCKNSKTSGQRHKSLEQREKKIKNLFQESVFLRKDLFFIQKTTYVKSDESV